MKARISISTASRAGICLAAVGIMLVIFASYRVPAYGYLWLPRFGEKSVSKMSGEFRSMIGAVTGNDFGYDGQFYAWLATDPLVLQAGTASALDDFQFRARRPLFALTAYLAGWGEPWAVLKAYSVQNVFFWLIFAGFLFRWLPPTSWQNTFRYLAVLFSLGWVNSIQCALLDGPALTILTLAVLLAELGKTWSSVIVLGVAGLGKETSVLAATLLAEPPFLRPREFIRFVGKACLVILPLAAWIYYLSRINSATHSTTLGNSQNFAPPFVGWWMGVQALMAKISDGQPPIHSLMTVLFLIGLPVQALALLALWQPSNPWWRVGVVYAVFTFFLGYATWSGLWGSAARICLPLTVAFNIVLPKTRPWLVVLALGNLLSIVGFYALFSLQSPYLHADETVSREMAADHSVLWTKGWYGEEKDEFAFWHWSSGEAVLEIHSGQAGDSFARFRFQTRAIRPTTVDVFIRGQRIAVFSSGIELGRVTEFAVPLKQGLNSLLFRPNTQAGKYPLDGRSLTFMLSSPSLEKGKSN